MQLKDGKRFFALNTDDHPSQMVEGDVSDALNIRMGSSDSQHESGIAETLQGELGVLINPDSLIVYYGQAVGGSFVYPGFEEIRVGTQIWMKKNWDAKYPGSKVYGDDENNRDVYGGLYTHGQILASDFCPDGWHVPTEAETDILIAELLGAAVAGGKMKDIGWWDAPNTGADDSSGFKGMPGGGFGMDVMYYGVAIGSDFVYDLLGSTGLLWLADEVPDAGIIADCDISNYNWAQVGNLLWLTENWKCPVSNSKVYDDLEINRGLYGGLYTYDMTQVPGFIPVGCRIPTLADIVYTMNYLGGAGFNPFDKLKEVGIEHWNAGNNGSDDFGVSLRGSGIFDEPRVGFQFIYSQIKEGMWFWIETDIPSGSNVIKVNYLNGEIESHVWTTYDVMISVRFVKDVI